MGPAVGIAGLLFAIYAFNKNRKPKRLQYEVRIDQEIVSHSRYTRWADLSVRFGDRDLKQPRVVIVRVSNTGKVEARGEDFDEPLAVSAAKGSEIIAATIVLRKRDTEESQEVEPAALAPTEVVAPRLLLNEGEWVEFRLLVEGDRKPVRLQGHAAGFRLATSPARTGRFVPISVLLGMVTIIALIFGYIILPFSWNTAPVPDIVGKPIGTAVAEINDANFQVGAVKQVRNAAPVGSVISVSPAAGKEVRNWTELTLVISNGP
jgi:hypothetical protein